MRTAILTVLSVVANAENILVDSGQRLTLTCNYRGIYVDINKEVKTNSEQRTQLLYLRVNNQQPNRIGDAGRPWKYNPTNSFYGSNETENKLSISLAKVDLDDEGVYFCKDAMKQVTKSYRVTVVAKPKSSVSFKMDLAIRDGTDELRVGKCESRGAKPAVKIVWEDVKGNQIDSGVLKSSFRGKLKDTVNELVLVDVDKAKHHQQQYRCVVFQNGSIVFTSDYSPAVNVEWRPEGTLITASPRLGANETQFVAGSAMKLSCSADGNPRPEFEWSILDGANRTLADLEHWTVGDSAEVNLNSATLSTVGLLASDSAITFVCSARNVHGVQTNRLQFDIQELPTANAGPMGLLWALLGVIAVVLAVAICLLINRWIQRRRSGIYKTEANHRDGSCDSLNDELQVAAAKKEYFM